VDKVSGPTCRSAELLSGRVHLTKASRRDPGRWDLWVPMSLTVVHASLILGGLHMH
jgi:hypothetical protein